MGHCIALTSSGQHRLIDSVVTSHSRSAKTQDFAVSSGLYSADVLKQQCVQIDAKSAYSKYDMMVPSESQVGGQSCCYCHKERLMQGARRSEAVAYPQSGTHARCSTQRQLLA